MNIANNILKHSLKNVYFLVGTALAGKTTMSKEIAKKYGFVHFNDNWHEDNFIEFKSICDEKYQPNATKRDNRFAHYTMADWDKHFDRPAEEILADDLVDSLNDEYVEFALIDLIKLSQKNKVIADIGIPMKLMTELADYNRIACMLTSPELITVENYGSREDHREYLEWMRSMNEPEKKIAKQDEIFRINTEKTFEEVRKYNLFSIVRTNESTVANTLEMLEKHFGLK